MSEPFSRLQRFLRELKRRKVYRVAAVYAAVAFVVIQVADLTFVRLGLPAWTVTLVIVLVALGFPLVLVGAWAFEMTPEGMRRTPEAERDGSVEEEPEPEMGTRTIYKVLVGLGLVAAAVAGGWYLTGGGGESPGLTEGTVAVLPFQVSGPDTETWQEGMVTMLGTGLDGAGELRVIADQTVIAAWKQVGQRSRQGNTPRFLRAARRVGAEYAIVGSAARLGGELRLTADLHETRSGDRLGQIEVRGSPERVTSLTDSLTRELLGVLAQESDQGLPSVELVGLTTESLDALKHYLEGEQHFRDGEYGESVERFRAAIREDSTFALAYARLAASRGMVTGSYFTGSKHWERAYRFSDRLPPRERGLVRAWYLLQNRGRALAAADTLRRLTDRYPDDPWAWYRLGEVLWHGNVPRGIPEAERAFERAVALDSAVAVYHDHLVSLAFSFRHDSALAARRIAAQPPNETRELNRLSMDLVFGSEARRRGAFARLDTIAVRFEGAPFWPLFDNLQHPTDSQLAARVARRLADRPDLPPAAARRSRQFLLLATLRQGRIDEAVRLAQELDVEDQSLRSAFGRPLMQGWPVPDSILAPLFGPPIIGREVSPGDWLASAVYQIQRGRSDDLARLRRRFRDRAKALADTATDPGMAALARNVLSQWENELEGYRAWRRGNLEQAAERWSGSPLQAGSNRTSIWRGDLYRKLGELERAEGWYLTDWSDPAVQERLGQLYEEMERPEEAAAAYRRFVAAWEDADEVLQERVVVARKRLKELTGAKTDADE